MKKTKIWREREGIQPDLNAVQVLYALDMIRTF